MPNSSLNDLSGLLNNSRLAQIGSADTTIRLTKNNLWGKPWPSAVRASPEAGPSSGLRHGGRPGKNVNLTANAPARPTECDGATVLGPAALQHAVITLFSTNKSSLISKFLIKYSVENKNYPLALYVLLPENCSVFNEFQSTIQFDFLSCLIKSFTCYDLQDANALLINIILKISLLSDVPGNEKKVDKLLVMLSNSCLNVKYAHQQDLFKFLIEKSEKKQGYLMLEEKQKKRFSVITKNLTRCVDSAFACNREELLYYTDVLASRTKIIDQQSNTRAAGVAGVLKRMGGQAFFAPFSRENGGN